jgi:site-specific DNA-cytosine methylase
MRILVACEESQRVCIAFRNKGHEAYSCDILPCSGGHPEWHLQQDVTELLKEKWDMIIAFPPCTYLTAAGACRMYPTKGHIDYNRLKLAHEAKEFFNLFLNADCAKICIENPRPLTVVELPTETQRIQPYMFGHPYTKLTYLWLKGLPDLKPTELITENVQPFVNAGSFTSNGSRRNKVGCKYNQLERSKTFEGIAIAMADQWGVKKEGLL